MAARIRAEATDHWDDTVAVERFVGKGGTFVRGRGRLVASNTIEVDGHRYLANRAVVIATGTTAAAPPIPGLADTPYWTNRQAIEVEQLPASMIVLGGAAIGDELAQVYARFGVAITIVEAADRLLPRRGHRRRHRHRRDAGLPPRKVPCDTATAKALPCSKRPETQRQASRPKTS